MPDDDRLLERLGRAIAPAPSEPSAAERRTLHRAVARFRNGPNLRAKEPESTTLSTEPVIYLPPMILRSAGTALASVRPKMHQPAASS